MNFPIVSNARYLVALIAGLVLWLAIPAVALAQSQYTVAVTTTADEYGSGTACSLREAVQTANNGTAFGGCTIGNGSGSGGDYRIDVAAGVYTLTIAGADEDANTSGDLDIDADVAIVGAGSETTILQACDVSTDANCVGIDRVLDVPDTATGHTLALSGVTVRKGNTHQDGDWSGRGGALRVAQNSSVTISDSTFVDNFGGYGGAIYQDGRDGHVGDSHLTITDSIFSRNSGEQGGAIMTFATTTTIENTTIGGSSAALGNVARGAHESGAVGGGIQSGQGVLYLRDSVVQYNSAEVGGGVAIQCTNNASTGYIERTLIRDNTARDGLGGGMVADGGNFACTINLTDSAVVANLANGRGNNSAGGGIWLYSGNVLNATNSTISGNSTEGSGGGIAQSGVGSRLDSIHLDYVTLTDNTADSNGDGGTGGAIYRSGNASLNAYRIANSILSGNRVNGAPGDCSGSLEASDGYNVFGQNGSADGCPANGTTDYVPPSGQLTSDIIDTTLALNAPGTTATHALLANSPARNLIPLIEGTSCSATGTTDQRGVARPQEGACDAGAYEFVPAPTVASVDPSSGPVAGGQAVTITGANLAGATAITFGGTAAANVNIVDAQHITATTPAHAAGTVDVAVTTLGGTADFAHGYTYIKYYLVGGTASYLAGSGLHVQISGGNAQSVTAADPIFVFDPLPDGTTWAVSVSQQPTSPAQTCTVVPNTASGTLAGADANTVAVVCATNRYHVGGTVSGLAAAGLTLVLNGDTAHALVVTQAGGADVPFVFPAPLSSGSSYQVSVGTQPSGQLCRVDQHATGTLGDGDTSNVHVTCVAAASALHLSIDDSHHYARYGMLMDYTLTLANSGNDPSGVVSVTLTDASLPAAAFDLANAIWQCHAGANGATCTDGTGATFTASVPAGAAVSWTVKVPILHDTLDETAQLEATAPPVLQTASDTDVLVLFRDGFDVPYADGTQ